MWGGRFFPAYHLRHTTYRLPPTACHLPTNHLSFQQHSRIQRVTTFVFYNIPALSWAAESWSFFFIDIPASFVQFSKLLDFSFPADGDILSQIG
jgi:hypothetical protein